VATSAPESRFFSHEIHTMQQQQLPTITPRVGARDLREGVLVSGKYRIEKLIARGGMGLVYRASQPMIARRVALKVVRPELLSHPDAAEKLINEACVLGQFQNDHVCRILDAGRLEDGAPYLVLEYLDGTDLRVLLNRENRIEPRRAVDWMMDLLEALAEAHALGIVHRDVKPENLVLAQTPSGESVKLLDFGICFARHVPGADERRLSEGNSVGSPHYMAPEQISSPDSSDHRIDIWSVGVVLFELLSGEPPFEGDNAMSICAQVLAREPVALTQLVPSLPAGLAQVVARCLSKEPDQRHADVLELAEALAPYATDGASEALPRIRRTLSYAPPAPMDAAKPMTPSGAGPASQRARAAIGEVSAAVMAGVLGTRAGAAVQKPLPHLSTSHGKEPS
jgi:serine/threonine protein kinase